MQELQELLDLCRGGDTSEGFRALKELELISDETGALYPYTHLFVSMISDNRYVLRVRGIRLFCKQARWDSENRINADFDLALAILDDVKPTAVRQGLAAFKEIALYKPELHSKLCEALSQINTTKYKDTVQGLIIKDAAELSALLRSGKGDQYE